MWLIPLSQVDLNMVLRLREPPRGAATDLTMAKARSLAEFQQFFPDEAHCAAFLFERRWPDGFVCPGCGARRAAALRSRAYTFECLDCGRQTSITAGTAMHRSKLPLTTWFWAAHLMATHSNGMSARQFEDQLGLTYKTAWLLTQKLGAPWSIQAANLSKASSKSIRRKSPFAPTTHSSIPTGPAKS